MPCTKPLRSRGRGAEENGNHASGTAGGTMALYRVEDAPERPRARLPDGFDLQALRAAETELFV